MTKVNYTEIICKAIRRAGELNKYTGKSYSASGGSEAEWKGMSQPLDVEVFLGSYELEYFEYVCILMKPNGDIFLSESALSDLGAKIDNPESADQIIEKAFKLLDEILARKENQKTSF